MTRGKSLTMIKMMIKMMMVMMFIVKSYTLCYSFFFLNYVYTWTKHVLLVVVAHGPIFLFFFSFYTFFLHVFFFKNQAHHNCPSLYIYYFYILYVCPTFSISQPILSRYARRNIRCWFSESIYIGYLLLLLILLLLLLLLFFFGWMTIKPRFDNLTCCS